jgi:hypothetical protein
MHLSLLSFTALLRQTTLYDSNQLSQQSASSVHRLGHFSLTWIVDLRTMLSNIYEENDQNQESKDCDGTRNYPTGNYGC